jgi:hypothetical protein
MRKFAALLFLLITSGFASAQQHITSPTEAFGFKPGTDRKLADWKELVAYYQKLAGKTDRIQYRELGKTTEGRPFVALTISSPENLKNIDEYKEITHKLSDARITSPAQAEALIKRGKTILIVTCNIHSTEIASSQSAAEFAYRMATGNTPQIQAILQNVIIVLVPSLNPDGEQLVVDWYKKYLGTPYEGVEPPVIWTHYTGHDDNRDWYAFTQQETRLTVSKVLNAYHPQILYDLHQMGADGPRLFLPPWVDPIDPNIDPLLVSSMNALGTETALDVAQNGRTGILIDGVYDLWSPARCYMCYHDTLRVLTESASANIASPIDVPFDKLGKGIGYDAKVAKWNFPNPWKGGIWRMGDIVDYQIAAFFSIASNASTYRERYLRDYYTIAQHQLEPKDAPYAYVIPGGQDDSAVVARLINILRFAEVEVQQSTSDFEAGGQQFPSGSFIVPMAQPFGAFAKTMLEIQHYPDIRQYPGGPPQRPYDVTAQTLPLLFDIKAVAVADKFTTPTTPVTEVKLATTNIPSSAANGYLIDDHSNSSLYALFALTGNGVKAYRLTGDGTDPGTIYLPAQPGLEEQLRAVTAKFPLHITAATAPPTGTALAVKLPRIALYKSWVPSMDEGWTRFIFDQNNIPYTRVVDADIRKGNLRDQFDVFVIPDNTATAITSGPTHRPGDDAGLAHPPIPPEYEGGLGPKGVAALDAFVHAGGTIVTLNKASEVYAKKNTPEVTNVLQGVPPQDFYVPGSILGVKVDTSNPIAFGATPTLPIFFELSPAFHVSGDAKSVATYTSDNPLLSGWILGGSKLNGQSALAEEPVGQGRVILFGFRPQYRAQSEGAYKLFFNALLYSSETPTTLGAVSASISSANHDFTPKVGK